MKFFQIHTEAIATVSLLFLLCVTVQMSLFKSSTMKGGSKGKEPVIDVDDLSPRSKRTHISMEVNDPDLFRSYAALFTLF